MHENKASYSIVSIGHQLTTTRYNAAKFYIAYSCCCLWAVSHHGMINHCLLYVYVRSYASYNCIPETSQDLITFVVVVAGTWGSKGETLRTIHNLVRNSLLPA